MSIHQGSRRGSGEEQDDRLTRDEIHFTLSNGRRRHVIQYLRVEGESSVKELSRIVAARENETSPDEITYDQRKTVYTALLQAHLPKLDDIGVVDYDESRKRVTITPRAAYLLPYLELVDEERNTVEDHHEEGNTVEDPQPPLVYPYLTVLVTGLAAAGVGFGLNPDLGLEGTLIVMLFFGVAVGISGGYLLTIAVTDDG